MGGGKRDPKETAVRKSLSELTTRHYNEYLDENPHMKEELNRVTKGMTGAIDNLPIGGMLPGMNQNPMDMMGAGLKYLMSGKDMKKALSMRKIFMGFVSSFSPELREYTDNFMQSLEMEAEIASRRDEVVSYLISPAGGNDVKKRDTSMITEEDYAEAARHVFLTKEDYIECMSADVTDGLSEMMKSLGPVMEDPEMGGMMGNMEGLDEFMKLKSDIARGVAKKEARYIYKK